MRQLIHIIRGYSNVRRLQPVTQGYSKMRHLNLSLGDTLTRVTYNLPPWDTLT